MKSRPRRTPSSSRSRAGPEEGPGLDEENAANASKDAKIITKRTSGNFLEDFQQDLTSKIDENNAALERTTRPARRPRSALANQYLRISPASALMFSDHEPGSDRAGRA